MKKFALTAAVAAAVFAGIPAYSADSVVIQKIDVNTVSADPVLRTNVIEGSAVTTTTLTTKTDKSLVPTLQPSVFVVNPPPALVSASGVIIQVVRPDDLITRQADVNARILVEQSAGTLTAAQANELLGRLTQVAAVEANMKNSGTMTWQQVERTYRSFDKISHDLENYSTDRDHRLAGSYIVL